MRMASSMLLVLGAVGCATSAGPRPGERATQSFRDEHREVRRHLSRVSAWISRLPDSPPAQQAELMRQALVFLRDHLVAHAEWEERILYPAVDRRVPGGGPPFTSSMRYEHRIVGRWIAELEAMAGRSPPDVTAFVRRGHNLLGLVWAHFEEEEEVLLPILDRSMTAEEFKRELGSGAP